MSTTGNLVKSMSEMKKNTKFLITNTGITKLSRVLKIDKKILRENIRMTSAKIKLKTMLIRILANHRNETR